MSFEIIEIIAILQSLFYLVMGVWPIVNIQSFVAVTRPKRDIWLVKTAGVLISVIALALVTAALKRSVGLDSFVLAVGAAVSLMLIDIIYVMKKVISPIYLLDAAAEGVLIVLWLIFMNF